MIAPLLIGLCFGFLLQKARLGRYETIVDVFRFKDLTVVKFLLTALAVAMVALQILPHPVPAPVPDTYLAGNLAGGVLFGIGMAVAGFCPGTVAAGAGEGRLDYLVAGSCGLYAGAVLFGLAWPRFFPALSAVARLGPVTAPGALGVLPWLLALVFAEAVALALYALQRSRKKVA